MTPPTAQARKAYQSAEVETCSQRDILVKLMEGVDRFMGEAAQALRNSQFEAAHTASSKARRILVELLSTLDFNKGGEVAPRLRDLYLFLISELTMGNLKSEPETIDKLRPIIQTLVDAWRNVPNEFANISSLGNGAVSRNTFRAYG
jgi:flagellar protein FliS